jgi:hypothetical protein
VRRIHELDEDLVRARGELVDDDRLPARVEPAVRPFIDRDVKMPQPGRHPERRFSKDGEDPEVVNAVTDDDPPLGKL